MNVRDTSIEAFEHIEGTGVLNKMQRTVYRYLFLNGPMTGGELDDQLSRGEAKRGNYHKRLSELQRMNAVREIGERACAITKRRSIVWEATRGPIVPMPKRKTKTERLRELCLNMADYLEKKHATSDYSDKDIADHIRNRLREIDA